MDERIMWIASLAGALLVSVFRKGRIRLGLLICLYAVFMYGFLARAAQGGFEAGLMVLIVIVNAAVFFLAGLWLFSSKKKKKPLAAPALLLIVVLAAGLYAVPLADEAGLGWELPAWLPQWEGREELRVHFIDVGQGDSILIHGPESAVLIDAGPSGAGEVVTEYLRSRGISKLDLVIATHPHEDHIGGMLQVLTNFEVEEVMDPGVVHTSQTFEDYLDLIDSRDIAFTEARAGMRRDMGDGVRLEVLHPSDPDADDLNNASIVVRLSYGGVAFLFTGDAEDQAEAEMLDSGGNLRADVLKAGHHGSSTSSSPEFIAAVHPDYAVIMLGEGNRYDHPHRETMDLLDNNDIELYRTDLHGNIVFTTNGDQIDVRATKHLDGASGGE